MRNLNRF